VSCETNRNGAAQAAGQNGISTTASKSSFSVGSMIGKGGGAAVGFGVGFAAGTVAAGPGLGSMAGGLAGAYLGYKAGDALLSDKIDNKLRERAERARQERTWKASPAGQKAIATRNERLRAAKGAYEEGMAAIKPREKEVKAAYDKAKSQWLKANSGASAIRDGNIGQALTSPEAKAALGGLVEGAIRVAGQTERDKRMNKVMEGWGATPTPGDRISGEVIKQAADYKSRLEAAREQAWLDSPEGEVVKERYDKGMAQLKPAKQEVSRKYADTKESAEEKYNQARTKFLSKLQPQQTAHHAPAPAS